MSFIAERKRAAAAQGGRLGVDTSARIVAAYLLVSGTAAQLATGRPTSAPYEEHWMLFVSDLVLALVIISQAAGLRSFWSERRHHWCVTAAIVVGAALLPALAVHPTGRGVIALFRWLGVAAVALAIVRGSGPGRRLIITTFAGVTAVQVALALAERAKGAPLGLAGLGEPAAHEIGNVYASTGLTVHPYVLAAWCVLAGTVLVAVVSRIDRPSLACRLGAAVPFIGIGLTMSRTGLVAVVLVMAALAVGSRRTKALRPLLVGAAVAAALGASLSLSGWMARATDSTQTSAAGVGSSRSQLVEQANGLLRDHPVAGVGPGRYVLALADRPELVALASQRPSRPVHIVPLLVVVEGGLVVTPALLLLAWTVARQGLRGGAVGLALVAAVLPFLLLDHLHWSFPQGLMLLGVWLGSLDVLGKVKNRAG